MTRGKAINLVRKYRAYIEKEGVPVIKVMMFGSQVNGTAHEWSDIDTCVVSSSFGKDLHAERVKLMHMGLEVSDLIEPHPYTPKQLEDPYDPLAAEIRKTGITV